MNEVKSFAYKLKMFWKPESTSRSIIRLNWNFSVLKKVIETVALENVDSNKQSIPECIKRVKCWKDVKISSSGSCG